MDSFFLKTSPSIPDALHRSRFAAPNDPVPSEGQRSEKNRDSRLKLPEGEMPDAIGRFGQADEMESKCICFHPHGPVHAFKRASEKISVSSVCSVREMSFGSRFSLRRRVVA
jgi:hypothetical protein